MAFFRAFLLFTGGISGAPVELNYGNLFVKTPGVLRNLCQIFEKG